MIIYIANVANVGMLDSVSFFAFIYVKKVKVHMMLLFSQLLAPNPLLILLIGQWLLTCRGDLSTFRSWYGSNFRHYNCRIIRSV